MAEPGDGQSFAPRNAAAAASEGGTASSADIVALFETGIDHHRAGRLEQAQAIYHDILAVDPGNADCRFRMGLLAAQAGRPDLAIQHLRETIARGPEAATYHLHLGMILSGLGRLDEAEACYRTALRLAPDYPEAHNNLANTLGQQGRLGEAEIHYRETLKLRPDLPEAYNNLGHVLNCLGRHAEAEITLRRALALRANYVAALGNLGLALTALGRFAEAEASYRSALGLRADIPELQRNLGNLLAKLRRLSEAADCYRATLRLKPDDAQAYKAMGDLFANASRCEEAAICYREAVRFDATLDDARNNLGLMIQGLGRHHEAIAHYDAVLGRSPGFIAARINRCIARLLVVYRDEAELVNARALFTEELEAICRLPAGTVSSDAIAGATPFYLAYQGRPDRDLQARYGHFVADVMAAHYPAWTSPPAVPPPQPGELIRVGFLSACFYSHSNWKIPIKGWLTGLDKQRFQIFGYHLGDTTDSETSIAKGLCHRFVQGRPSLEAWAETIRADRLHVLIIPGIGLDGVTHRLAALRLAPVQATSWGHPDTTGLPTIDHYLSSDLMEPPDGDAHYTERLIRLPNLSIAYEPPAPAPAALSRADIGVPADATFYWCCQSLFKYLPRHDWVFARIAAAVPDARFVFIEYPRGDAVNAIFRERLGAAFAAAGLDATRHCIFMPPLDSPRFAAIGKMADLFLDSLGWSGCNSTLEALALDLPVITMAGDLMRGRHSAAILTMLGMPELIAPTPEAFAALAIRLGRDGPARQALRARIAREKHRLYRDQAAIDGLARYLEHAAREPAATASEPGG
jgi:protein O-GlcNAc transferase